MFKTLEIERIQATTQALLDAANERGFVVSADRRVSERDAASLLGYAPGHLKNMRQEGRGPANYLRGLGGQRVSYRLEDLACWIESARED